MAEAAPPGDMCRHDRGLRQLEPWHWRRCQAAANRRRVHLHVGLPLRLHPAELGPRHVAGGRLRAVGADRRLLGRVALRQGGGHDGLLDDADQVALGAAARDDPDLARRSRQVVADRLVRAGAHAGGLPPPAQPRQRHAARGGVRGAWLGLLRVPRVYHDVARLGARHHRFAPLLPAVEDGRVGRAGRGAAQPPVAVRGALGAHGQGGQRAHGADDDPGLRPRGGRLGGLLVQVSVPGPRRLRRRALGRGLVRRHLLLAHLDGRDDLGVGGGPRRPRDPLDPDGVLRVRFRHASPPHALPAGAVGHAPHAQGPAEDLCAHRGHQRLVWPRGLRRLDHRRAPRDRDVRPVPGGALLRGQVRPERQQHQRHHQAVLQEA
mmetsp:Transcript_24138/g.55538  ORF Transcript_24138/g.55538 Transcript_24138/m.55538 type:complete len:377 (+) Transcript_24138:1974-3104(+)